MDASDFSLFELVEDRTFLLISQASYFCCLYTPIASQSSSPCCVCLLFVSQALSTYRSRSMFASRAFYSCSFFAMSASQISSILVLLTLKRVVSILFSLLACSSSAVGYDKQIKYRFTGIYSCSDF